MTIFIKELLVQKRSTSGRDNLGHLTSYRKGGGFSFKYLLVDYKRKYLDIFAKVLKILNDKSRSSQIGLVLYKTGYLAYILLPIGVNIGDVIVSRSMWGLVKAGDSFQIGVLPLGTVIHNIELKIGQGGVLCRAAGTSAKIISQHGLYCLIEINSGVYRYIRWDCRATVGRVSLSETWSNKKFKAGFARKLGIRPSVRGVAKNPVDHPNGGNTNGGKVYKDAWGNLSKGSKTRKLNKKNIFIVKRSKD